MVTYEKLGKGKLARTYRKKIEEIFGKNLKGVCYDASGFLVHTRGNFQKVNNSTFKDHHLSSMEIEDGCIRIIFLHD